MKLNIWGTRSYNLRHNRKCEKMLSVGKFINGQRLGSVSKMRYGLCRLSFNGCECIAVYNAFIYINKPHPLSEIIYGLERFKMLSGIFGCNPYRLGKIPGLNDAAFERTEDMKKNGGYILSFWTGVRFLSTIHTVFCIAGNNGITVYNRYGSCSEERYFRSASELTYNKKPIAIYYINKLR